MTRIDTIKTVWITRTQPSADESAQAFKAAGYKTVIAPVLKVEIRASEKPAPENAVLIFTSQNGVRAFCGQRASRDYDVVTVGDATAKLARDMGFSNVKSAAGTSDDITSLIARSPDDAALYLHISGQHVRGTVCENLRALGLSAERQIYYHSTPVSTLPNIDVDAIDVAVLFSPLAAKTVSELMPRDSQMTCLSISAATDEALGDFERANRLIARAPTLESLIAALRETG